MYLEHYDLIDQLKTAQEKKDVIHDLLTIDGIHEEIRDELRGILSNIMIKEYMDEKYPSPVKEKKKRAPRVKKPITDAGEVQGGLDAPVVKRSAEPALVQV